MLDLNHVAVFVHVVREGSFAAAARHMNIPPTTLSRHVRQLEDHLGVRLLQRSTRKLVLTDAGRSFHERSAPQVEDLLEAARQAADDVLEPGGIVRIAAPADFFDFYLMEWVGDFLKKHPAVSLDFVLSDGMVDLIGDGIDIAFRGGELQDSSLVARRLSVERFVLAASPDYLAERGIPGSPEALSEHECICSSRNRGQTQWSLVGPTGVVEVKVTGRLSANTARAQLQAAVSGLGICLLPETLMSRNLRAGELAEVLPLYGRSGGDFYVVYPSRRHIPSAVKAFVDMAAFRFKTLTS